MAPDKVEYVEVQQDPSNPPFTQAPVMMGHNQSPEFLRYLIDNSDPLIEIQYELEGKEVVMSGETPQILQLRVPIVNPSLRNIIMGLLKTYNTKSFSTTTFTEKQIQAIVRDVAFATIRIIKRSKIFSSNDWKKDKHYLSSYPAFLEGEQDHILLLIEHSTLAGLNRSIGGLTLNKVTGVHQSIEQRTNLDQKKGFRLPIFKGG